MSLASAADGSDLFPGSSGGMETLAIQFTAFGQLAAGAVDGLHALDTAAWTGSASEAFSAILGDVPAKLEDAAVAFGEAGAAVSVYAEALTSAQTTGERAIELYCQGTRQTAKWEDAWDRYRDRLGLAESSEDPESVWVPARPSSSDPGGWERAEAERMVENARSELDAAADRARSRMHEAWRLAPDAPGFWSRAWNGVKQFGLGAWDSVYGMGEFVVQFSTIRMLVDPDGWTRDVAAMAQGLSYGAQHPVEFGKAMTNWETWQENPVRALGQLVPDLALTLVTAGGGSAAAAGRRGADALDTATDLATSARRADDLTDARSAFDLSDINAAHRRPGDPLPGSRIPNRFENCPNCVVATDATLSGSPASALPGLPQTLPEISAAFSGRPFRPARSIDEIVSEIAEAGPGARAVVGGFRSQGIGHVWNIINDGGVVKFVDGQIGEVVTDGFEQYVQLYVMRTN